MYPDTLIHLKHQNYTLRYLIKSRGYRCLVTKACPMYCVAHQAPLAMGFPGKSAGVGCHVLLQGIFLTQRSRSHLCIGRQVRYQWAAREAQWLLQGLQIAFAPQIWSAMRCQCYYMSQGWFFQMNSALLCFPDSYLVQGGLYATSPGDDDTSYHTGSEQGHQLRAAGKKTSAERKAASWS